MTTLPKGIARRLRRLKGVPRSRCPVEVVTGELAPTRTGEAGHNEFKGGGRVDHPRAAMNSGYRIHYVPSTLRIQVGDVWLAAEMGHTAPLAERLGLRPDTPAEILADWMQERDLSGWEMLRSSAVTGRH